MGVGTTRESEGTPFEGFHKERYCQLWSSYLAGRSPTGVGTWSLGDWLPGFKGPYPSTTLDKKFSSVTTLFNCWREVYHWPFVIRNELLLRKWRPGPGPIAPS